MELERYGLRRFSSPFDWLIIDSFKNVIDLIKNKFDNFLNYDNLFQESINPNYYFDKNYNIHFYHDFVAKHPLKAQYNAVKEKYSRRIDRFYKIISNPTIFIRYCSKKDLNYINENYSEIITFLKSFNAKNKLILIYQDDFNFINDITAYKVTKDENDTVAREFVKKNDSLKELFKTYSTFFNADTKKNINIYKKKRIKRFIRKIISKFNSFLYKFKILKVYKHDKIYYQE